MSQAGNSAGNSKKGLGMGMGMNAQQQQGFEHAASTGQLNPWLQQNHLMAKYNQALNAGGGQAKNAQTWEGVNANGGKAPVQSAGMPAGPITNPTGNTGVAGPSAANNKQQAAATAKAQQTPTFQQGLNAQFGTNNPFGMRGNYQDPNNPMYAGAQRAMQQQLAQTRARYAGNGLGDSGREALAEGNTIGDFGAQIAALGEQAYQNDANRGLSAIGQAGQQQLAANQQLANLGTGLTGIGASEQAPAGLQGLMGLLSGLVGQSGNQSSNQAGSGGWWTK